MQENNFEKKVQEKMDELSLSPSGEVWQKLSVTIAKDKRNRRYFVIISLLLLVLGSTFYIIFQNSSGKEIQPLSSGKNNPDRIKSNGKAVIENKASTTTSDTTRIENEDKNLSAFDDKQHSGLTPVTTLEISKPAEETNAKVDGNTVSFSKRDIASNKNNSKAGEFEISKKGELIAKGQPNVLVSEGTSGDLELETLAVNESGREKEVNDRQVKKIAYSIEKLMANPLYHKVMGATTVSIVQLQDSFVQMITSENKKPLIAEKKAESGERKGWEFGLDFSLGASTTEAGLLGIVVPRSGDESKVFDNSAQNNPGGNPPVIPVVYSPSQVNAGAGIVIGGFAKKNISSGASIGLGLNFKMLTSSIRTGAKVDSTGFLNSNNLSARSIYYRNGNQQNFKNHFYFIELPVSIKLQLNKQKKVPVYLTTGINFAWLINTNALQFDQANGTYYHDNTLLNKTQLSGSLGVLFSLNSKTKNPFLVGPDLHYSFNNMAHTGLYKNRHYSFIGLTLQKTIGKK